MGCPRRCVSRRPWHAGDTAVRALGLDLGSKRIGVAVSDRSGDAIVVVGLPLNMNGSMGPTARAAVAEAEALATVVGVPVTTYDERRTTVTADRAMLEAGLRAPERRKHVDKVAAAVMLQQWLDRQRGGSS